MTRQVIPYLVKFFPNKEYADQFVAGHLFLNRLSYFKKIESADGRSDAYEAVANWWQPTDISIQFSMFPDLTITSKDLAAPVFTSFDFHDHLHIYCMYAVSVPDYVLREPTFECDANEAEYIRKLLEFDERCFQFGEFAVIIAAVPFLDQIKTALKGKHACRGKSVKYYDERLFHGSFEHEEIPFRKQKRFEYQREFRLCINTGTKDSSPLILNIGSIETFSKQLPSRQLNELFKFKTESI